VFQPRTSTLSREIGVRMVGPARKKTHYHVNRTLGPPAGDPTKGVPRGRTFRTKPKKRIREKKKTRPF